VKLPYSAPMANFPRYAIYHAAAPGSALDRFGAHHLGYDAWTGKDLPFPDDVMQTMPDWRDLTDDPRRYGFHATLKAPMPLAQGRTEAELLTACAAFAATPRLVPLIKPMVQSIGGFIAVVPAERSSILDLFAADCVRAFDGFRAPLTPDDRARRNPHLLTPRQCEYLDRWGYPYVMEEFRFHMTLTGSLASPRRERVLAMLQQRFAAINLETLAIDRIALFRQTDAAARFGIIGQWQLRAASRKA
jgi:putative phosphonate metabolism protein